MTKQSLLFLFLVSVFSFSFAQEPKSSQSFKQFSDGLLKTLFEQHTVVETKENNTRKLLVKQSIKGEKYGKFGRIYFFTEEGHFAHPSIMIVQLIEKDGHRFVSRNGSSGGDKAKFEQWVNESISNNTADTADILSEKTAPQANQPAAAKRLDPPAEFVDTVKKLTYAYFSAKDQGEYETAYAFFESNVTTFDKWRTPLITFNNEAGKVIVREIKKITWYEYPPGELEGIYAAIDYESRFENYNIHCGYVAWRLQSDKSFLLVREEEGYISKAIEKKIHPSQINNFKREQLKCRT